MDQLKLLQEDIKKNANKEKAIFLQHFFKTKKGEYAEGDVFIGLTVPQSRVIAKKFSDLSLEAIERLLESPIHEERLIALLILIDQFNKAIEEKQKIYNFYLHHKQYINNWDLVDMSAPSIVGAFLVNKKNKSVLTKLALSQNIWERRIAIIATFAFLYKGEYEVTLFIAEVLLHDKHDLIQKAVGWMLREVGKRCSETAEELFLNKY